MGSGARAGIGAMILAASAAAGGAPLVGTPVRVDSGELTLRLADGRAEALAAQAGHGPERGRAPGSRWQRGLKGAAIGAAAALTATLSWWALSDDPEKDVGLGFGLLLYTPAAAGLGFSIGLALPPARRGGELAPPRASRAVGLQRHAPPGIQVSVRF